MDMVDGRTEEERRQLLRLAVDRLISVGVHVNDEEPDDVEAAECPGCMMAAAFCYADFELSQEATAFCCEFCPGLLAHVA